MPDKIDKRDYNDETKAVLQMIRELRNARDVYKTEIDRFLRYVGFNEFVRGVENRPTMAREVLEIIVDAIDEKTDLLEDTSAKYTKTLEALIEEDKVDTVDLGDGNIDKEKVEEISHKIEQTNEEIKEQDNVINQLNEEE